MGLTETVQLGDSAPARVLLLTGQINATRELTPPEQENHISRFADGQPLAVEARVLSVEHRSMNGYRLVAETLRVFETSRIRRSCGRVLLNIGQGELQAWPGQVIRWRSRLRRPSVFGNPGEFKYPLYLASQGIHVTGFISSADDLVVVVNHPLRKIAVLENLRLDLPITIKAFRVMLAFNRLAQTDGRSVMGCAFISAKQ